MNSVLGNLWHLLNPALQITVYWLIMGVVLGVSRGVDNFIAYLTIGIFTYQYAQRSTMAGAKCVRKNRGLITIISFPRVLLPVTSTAIEALALVPGFLVMYVVAIVTGEEISWSWLLVVPNLALFTLFNVGLAMTAARATSHLADVEQVLPFLFRFGFYGSGVIFNVQEYVQRPEYQLFFELNPFYCFIELNRTFILGGDLDPLVPLSAVTWTTVMFVGGFLWFRAGEDRYGE